MLQTVILLSDMLEREKAEDEWDLECDMCGHHGMSYVIVLNIEVIV